MGCGVSNAVGLELAFGQTRARKCSDRCKDYRIYSLLAVRLRLAAEGLLGSSMQYVGRFPINSQCLLGSIS